MTYERPGESPLDYYQCRYGSSKLLFRGPKRNLKGRYNAFLGGTDIYGKYIESPFPTLLEDRLEIPCANFGAVNAGIDAFMNEPHVLELCSKARTTVVQALGAQNMSNRFYSVHPRRNDRFLKASSLLETVYRDVDFSEFSFTRHMLKTLKTLSPERFAVVEAELKCAWVCRMDQLLKKITGRTVLLWVTEDNSADVSNDGLGVNPLFVDRDMIDYIRPIVTEVVEVKLTSAMLAQNTEGMLFPAMEAGSAKELYGPKVHQHIADKLAPVLR